MLRFTFILFFIFSIFIEAQPQSLKEVQDDFSQSFSVGKNLLKSVVKPQGDTQTGFLIGAGATAIAFTLDKKIRNFALNNQSEFAENIFSIDNYYGHTKYMLISPVVLYAGGLLSQNKTLKEMGLHTAQAVIYTGAFTMLTKIMSGRSRPFREKGPFDFNPFSFHFDNRSFFSGHTSIVFAFSTVMASKIDNIIWKMSWFTAATLVAGARIYSDKHWASDVIAGAFVGYGIGSFIVLEHHTFDKNVTVSGAANLNGIPIINLTYAF
jgi:hypothetical protein